MEIQAKELEYCKLQVSCLFSEEEIKSKKSEVVKIFKDAPVPGFRKGKTTSQIIQYYYKNQIDEALKRSLSEDSFHQSMFQEQFKPIGTPSFTEMFLTPSRFSCQFIVHTKPQFELKDISGLEVPEPHKDFTQSDIYHKLVEEIRNIQGERVPFTEDNFIEIGDLASVSYDAYVNDQKMDEYSSYGEVIPVGSSQIPGFDSNLLGMKIGDKREFTLSFENNLQIKFIVNLNMAMKIIPVAYDDALAQKMGKSSLQDLDQEVSAQSFSIFEKRVRALKINSVNNKLLSIYDFKIPDWLTDAESKLQLRRVNKNLKNEEIDNEWNSLDSSLKEKLLKQSSNNIKLSLILEKVRESEPEAQLSDHELIEFGKQYLSATSDPTNIEDLLKSMSDSGQLQMFLLKIKDEHTVNFLLKTVKFID